MSAAVTAQHSLWVGALISLAEGGQSDPTWHHAVHLTSGQLSRCHLEVSALKNPHWGIWVDLVIGRSPHPSFQKLAPCYLSACHYFCPNFTFVFLFLCFGLNCFRLLRFRQHKSNYYFQGCFFSCSAPKLSIDFYTAQRGELRAQSPAHGKGCLEMPCQVSQL